MVPGSKGRRQVRIWLSALRSTPEAGGSMLWTVDWSGV